MQQTDFNIDDSAESEEASRDDQDTQVLSVAELNRRIRGSLEGEFDLIWLQAEVSNFKPHTSGHWYFSLKDDRAQVAAVMFRGHNSRIKFRPENGMEVLIRGKVTVFEPRGNYQVFCETMEPVGAGALQKQFEQLKEKLQKEGLFAKEKKRPLPKLPQRVAVVTSPTGAAVRDILHVFHRRFRGLEVTIVPTLVQGATAAPQIIAALKMAYKLKNLDAIILGRGGGSMEDLWCFNDEQLARTIANSPVPIVSGVGHEIDFTISDFVADYRAPTPSAAAEVVCSNVVELIDSIDRSEKSLIRAIEYIFSERRQKIDNLKRHLIDPKKSLREFKFRCAELEGRLVQALRRRPQQWRKQLIELDRRNRFVTGNFLKQQKNRVVNLGALMDSLSPLKVVERGYSIVKIGGRVVKDTNQIKQGDILRVQFAKGHAEAQVTDLNK
jgi:exodeoxyribonuclease VII large subunit